MNREADLKSEIFSIPNDLKMYSREEVAQLLGTTSDHITLLSQVGCLSPTRIGRRYMYSYETIKQFQMDYRGLDVSNKLRAIQSFELVKNIKDE